MKKIGSLPVEAGTEGEGVSGSGEDERAEEGGCCRTRGGERVFVEKTLGRGK